MIFFKFYIYIHTGFNILLEAIKLREEEKGEAQGNMKIKNAKKGENK